LLTATPKKTRLLAIASAVLLVILGAALCVSQITNSGRGVVRLRVRVKSGESTKGLARKRFFLIKGTLEQNRSWIQLSEQETPRSRDCYYRAAGASEQFIKWLQENDCESVYCKEVSPEFVEGPNAVPEFHKAVVTGTTEFKSAELARKWLSVNLPAELRDGFYRSNRDQLLKVLRAAESVSGATVQSVMTDRNGTAYFTDIEPGNYLLSNLLPSETATSFLSWHCEMQIKPGDISTERPFLISNRKDRNVKCVAVERPLPACPTAAKG
jgi:hypothetical protein